MLARLQRNGSLAALACAAGLLTLGLIMLYSSSAFARDANGDPFFFLKKQVAWLVLGLVFCGVTTLVPLHVWRKLWIPLTLVTLVLLGLCLVPGIGLKLNGSMRWVRLGPLSFQPSELAKITTIIVSAHFLAMSERWRWKSPLAVIGVVGVMVALILLETDLGTSALLLGTAFLMLYVHGLRWYWIVAVLALCASAVAFVAIRNPNRLQRVTAFLELEKEGAEPTKGEGAKTSQNQGTNYQQNQGLIALGSGGLTGVGLGASRQKLHYLPYAHTDFINCIIGEELGLRGTLAVTAGFFLLGAFAFLQARALTDPFAKLVCVGVGSLLLIQAGINIAVTTALMPNKGMPLPFISAGGSNLCACLLLIGLLLRARREMAPVAQ